MNVDEIQLCANTLMSNMVARGLVNPLCHVSIVAQQCPYVYLHWCEDGIASGRTEIARGDTVVEALKNAAEILEAIPPKEDRDKAEFTRHQPACRDDETPV